MPEKRLSARRRALIYVALTLPVLILCALVFLSRQGVQHGRESGRWVEHTIQVKNALTRLQALVLDAESSQRGFLLTKRPDYLQPYLDALPAIPAAAATVRELTRDNPVQQQRLDTLDQQLHAKAEHMRNVVTLQQQGRSAEVLTVIASGRGKTLMDTIRRELDAMSREEDRLLAEREAAQLREVQRQEWLTWILGANCLAVVIGVGILLHKLRLTERLVRMCAWSQTIEHEGEWLAPEEYLRRRFDLEISHGVSPEQAEKLAGEWKRSRSTGTSSNASPQQTDS